MGEFRFSRRVVARALVLAPAFALMGFTTRDYVYRYRLTLDVDTPEGVKSGASVLEISTRETERRVFRKLKGEAVVIDLGARSSTAAPSQANISDCHSWLACNGAAVRPKCTPLVRSTWPSLVAHRKAAPHGGECVSVPTQHAPVSAPLRRRVESSQRAVLFESHFKRAKASS